MYKKKKVAMRKHRKNKQKEKGKKILISVRYR